MPVAADDDAVSIQPGVGAVVKDRLSLPYMLGEGPGAAIGGILDGEQAIGFLLAKKGSDAFLARAENHLPVDLAQSALQRARKDHAVECFDKFLKLDLCEPCHSVEPSLCLSPEGYGCA